MDIPVWFIPAFALLVVFKFALYFAVVIFYNPHSEKRVLLDSGVTWVRNIGDRALLEEALTRYPNASWIRADKQNIVKEVLQCDVYVMVSGGLLKDLEPKYFRRKLYAVFLARLFHKEIIIETQTVFLKGFYRALFKLVFYGLTIYCRDMYSLADVKALGLKAEFKPEPLLKKQTFKKRNYFAVDSRVFHYPELTRNVLRFTRSFRKQGYKIKIAPTMHTDLTPEQVQRIFGEATLSVCCSYHAVVFSRNADALHSFVCSPFWEEYQFRKLSGIF